MAGLALYTLSMLITRAQQLRVSGIRLWIGNIGVCLCSLFGFVRVFVSVHMSACGSVTLVRACIHCADVCKHYVCLPFALCHPSCHQSRPSSLKNLTFFLCSQPGGHGVRSAHHWHLHCVCHSKHTHRAARHRCSGGPGAVHCECFTLSSQVRAQFTSVSLHCFCLMLRLIVRAIS